MNVNDTESCYRAVKSRDRRFDGVFYTAVRTTGIYCRPSCPAITPQQKNITFYRTAAAAQHAGYRACKRCLPDATPGSPEWDVAADTAGRAMRLIADGVVERDGVEGLARMVGYTSRHLTRLLTSELGAGPLALSRARRAQTARILIETTSMSFVDVAFAAGFASVRQFNDTVREVYAASPTQLRGRRRSASEGIDQAGETETPEAGGTGNGRLELRLAVRRPFAAGEMLAFLAGHAVSGVEQAGPGWYARTLRLPHGAGSVRLTLEDDDSSGGTGFVRCELRLEDLRDVTAAVERCRRLLDADCDPVAVDDQLVGDPNLAHLVRSRPGLRVPGSVDGQEVAVRAVIGQQVSVAGARTVTAALVQRHGVPVVGPADTGLSRLFPTADVLAEVPPEELPMPRSRGRALNAVCAALAAGEIPLDRSAPRSDVRRLLLAVPGIGPWTADYVAMRALADPDVFMPTDIGVRRALDRLGEDPLRAEELSQEWRPWRAYAQMHLWSLLAPSAAEDRSRTKER